MIDKIKILMLCSKKYWNEKMDRDRFHSMQAIKRHPEVDGVFDGPGFPGWVDAPTSVKTNKPDIIFWYKPLIINGYNSIDNIPKVMSYNEMHTISNVEEEMLSTNTNIIICHLENESDRYTHLTNISFEKISHCVETSVFKNYNEPKIYDILLTGIVHSEIYPLRHKFNVLMRSGNLAMYKTKILSHPGYEIKNPDAQIVRYATELNKAKIVLTCSSVYKFALSKYFEIAACNSLCVGDIPAEKQELFNQFVVNVDFSWPNPKIIETIRYWLNNNEDREKRTKIGHDLITSEYNQDKYANRFVEIIKKHLNK